MYGSAMCNVRVIFVLRVCSIAAILDWKMHTEKYWGKKLIIVNLSVWVEKI